MFVVLVVRVVIFDLFDFNELLKHFLVVQMFQQAVDFDEIAKPLQELMLVGYNT